MKKVILFLICVSVVFSAMCLATFGASSFILDTSIANTTYDKGFTINNNSDSFGNYKSFVFINKTSSNPVQISLENNVNYPPHISASFTLSKDGTVYLWIRAKAAESGKTLNADSIFWAFDGSLGSDYKKTALAITDEYEWIRVGAKVLDMGSHTLNLFGREKYLEVSHIRIVDSSKNLVWDGSPYNKPSVYPKENTHPRVLVNEETLPTVKANYNHPDNADFLTLHNLALNKTVDEASTTYHRDHPRKIQSLAFEYLINNDEAKGKEAIRLLKNRLDTVVYTSTDDYNTSGKYIYASALVYDWCFDLLADEDKEYILEKSLEIASIYSEMGWPPVNQNGFGGHGSENTLLKDLLALGIAVYDEYPDLYEVTAGRIMDEYIWPRQVYFSAHKSLFGTDYGVYRGKNDLTCALLFKAIGVDNIWGTDEYAKTPYWYIYAKRPDRYFLEDGDGRENQSAGLFGNYTPSFMQMGISSMFGDGYLKSAAKEELSFRLSKYKNYNIYEEYLETLISNDVTLEEKNIEDLNLSYYFPYPSGSYIARTGWDDNSMMVSMKMNELTIGDHNHLDAGGFQIYYKGNLATDSGYYQGIYEADSDEYYGNYFGDIYHQAYYRQTIAHNCMLVYDPNEADSNFVSDSYDIKINTGGQRSNSIGETLYPANKEGFYTDEKMNTSKVLAREHDESVKNPDYTYLKGDLSNAYSDKVKEYERTFMFLNLKNEEVPGALIVLDHVVSKYASYKKTFLLHGVNAPQIDNENKRVTLVRDEKNVAPSSVGKEGYNYNGKLTNDVLLPKNATITQVGESKEDYYVNNVNLKTVAGLNGDEGVAEGGGIRTEISPSTSAKEDYFLNVMQVSDADSTNEPIPVSINESSETHIGVEIADRVIMLSKTKEKTSSDVLFEISLAGSYNISVDGLEEGKWYVYKDDAYHTSCEVTEDGSIAYFRGTPGKYTLTKTFKKVEVKAETTKSFYPGFYEYLSKNAFLTFGKIDGFSYAGEIIDFGFIVAEGKNAEGREYVISIKDKGYLPDKNGSMQFGVIFYGDKVKNFYPYSYKSYVIYKDDGGEHTLYSEPRYDFIRNLGSFNSYPVTEYEVNE